MNSLQPPARASSRLIARRRPAWRREILPALALSLALSGLPLGNAQAAQTATLKVAFSPYRLKVNTALTFAIHIGSTTGSTPLPVTSVSVRFPAGMGLSTSQLGLAVCELQVLRVMGVAGCSQEAVMGLGTAVMRMAVGSESLEVPIDLTLFMAPARGEHTALLVYAEGQSSVIAELAFPGLMLGDSGSFGTRIDLAIPPIATVPGDPAASLVSMRVTIDPRQLLYPERVHGKRVRYHPRGMAIPAVCPVGGFPFAANIHFENNTSVIATTTVACPSKTRSSETRSGRRGQGG